MAWAGIGWRSRVLLAAFVVVATACGGGAHGARSTAAPNVRIALAGDVMLGRGMGAVTQRDGNGVFAGVRHVFASADIAAANLESPLTTRQHIAPTPNILEAPPGVAGMVAAAGFDVMSIANNHAGDAGAASVVDTIEAVRDAGMLSVGGGRDLREAERPVIVDRGGLRVAFLAFDATRVGLAAGTDTAGVVGWDESRAHRAVDDARDAADVVIVSLHGGIEYLPGADPAQQRLADKLAAWGVDVVWGHGPHVLQPVSLIQRPDGGTTVVATSLGNLVFDQQQAGTTTGGILEVLVGRTGVVAYRLGVTDQIDGRVHLDRWTRPERDAVLLDGEWWSPIGVLPSAIRESPLVSLADLSQVDGDVVDARLGDANGDAVPDVVVSFRTDYRPTLITVQFPDRVWADSRGRAARLGVYHQDGGQIWVAGTMFRPVAKLAVCDGALALAFDELDSPGVVATSAWRWQGYGFTVPVELPGPGQPGCADVDGDGRLDPYITRNAP